MSEEKLDASVPVCVEIVPTVMEFGRQSRATLAAAPAVLVVVTMPTQPASSP